MNCKCNKLLKRALSLALVLLMVLPFVSSVTVGAQEITKKDIQEKMLQILYGGDENGFMSCDFDGYVELRPKRHEGIDFAIGLGHEVHALISGVVVKAGGDSLNTIAIYDKDHDKTVIYLHAKRVVGIKVGDEVKAGQVIAEEGSKGANGAVHTHVEVRDGKQTHASVSGDYVLDNENPYEYWETVLFEKPAKAGKPHFTRLEDQDSELPAPKK